MILKYFIKIFKKDTDLKIWKLFLFVDEFDHILFNLVSQKFICINQKKNLRFISKIFCCLKFVRRKLDILINFNHNWHLLYVYFIHYNAIEILSLNNENIGNNSNASINHKIIVYQFDPLIIDLETGALISRSPVILVCHSTNDFYFLRGW